MKEIYHPYEPMIVGLIGIGLVLLIGFTIMSCICTVGDVQCASDCALRQEKVDIGWLFFAMFIVITGGIMLFEHNAINNKQIPNLK